MTKFKQVCMALCATALLALSSFAPADGGGEYSVVRETMRELVDRYKLPSLSLAIGKDQRVVFAEALGYAKLESEQPATPQTQYSVASLAKPMTALTLLKLADSGAVELDAPVSSYLTQPAYVSQFSVRELAAHLTGIPHDTPEREQAEFISPKDHDSPFDAFFVFERQSLLFEPGTDSLYSSNGYLLLSALIERVSEMGFVALLESAIWPALNMSATELDTSTAGKGPEASYYAGFDDETGYREAAAIRDRSFLFGAGGFLSTPSDMVKLARGTYDPQFLSGAARRAMYAPTALRNGEPNEDDFSVGWQVGSIRLDSGTKWMTLEHAGLMEGAATAYLLVVPQCQQSIAFATNFVPKGFWGMHAVMARLLRLSIDEAQCQRGLRY